MDFTNIPSIDKLLLLNALGVKELHPEEEINNILSKSIKSYDIDYTTGNLNITYKEPIEICETIIDLNKGEE